MPPLNKSDSARFADGQILHISVRRLTLITSPERALRRFECKVVERIRREKEIVYICESDDGELLFLTEHLDPHSFEFHHLSAIVERIYAIDPETGIASEHE